MQEALKLFHKLANISKYMEGDQYILSSTYWVALSAIEHVFAPNPADSPPVAALRAAMYNDHFSKRVNLSRYIENPLHVVMHLLDHRSVICFQVFSILISDSCAFIFYVDADGGTIALLCSRMLNTQQQKPLRSNTSQSSFRKTLRCLYLCLLTRMLLTR